MPIFQNKATLSWGGGTVDSNTVTGNLQQTLTLAKTAITQTYSGGSRVTYLVSIANSGAADYTALTLTDNLGAYTFGAATVYPLVYEAGSVNYFLNGVPAAAPAVGATQPLTFTGLTVPAGGNAILIYSAEVTNFAPLDVGGQITNTVTLGGTAFAEDLTASAIVSADETTDLSIIKALCPTVVQEGGVLNYTFTISNAGNLDANATDDLSLTDVFDPAINITSVTLNGVALTEGTDYTYDQATGTFATLPGVITVPAATFTQNPDGSYSVAPGQSVLTVSGTV